MEWIFTFICLLVFAVVYGFLLHFAHAVSKSFFEELDATLSKQDSDKTTAEDIYQPLLTDRMFENTLL